MHKKVISLTLIMTMCLGMLGGILIVSFAGNATSLTRSPMDIGPELRGKTVENYPQTSSYSPVSAGAPSAAQDDTYYNVGDVLEWYGLDDYNPDVPDDIFTCAFQLYAIGDIAEVWVQVDMSFPDSRDAPVITTEQAEYFLDVFEINIYPTVTDYFGTPDLHDGSQATAGDLYYEETGRSVILISNIRDESYYDQQYPYYIVGFYWGVFEKAFDRNIISIDSENFEERMAMYEGTLAHEYQHLIHDDYNPLDDTFMNEGCSMYAEPLCGYPIDYGSIGAYLATPDNSLTEWGDQGGINTLADYGQALLFAVYLSDHYGGADFLSYFVKTGSPGITGLNEALAHFGFSETFDDVFHAWSLANLLHTDAIGEGKYNYISLDLNTLDQDAIRVYDVRKPFVTDYYGTDFGESITYINDKTGVSKLGSYGSDYIRFGSIKTNFNPMFTFDGNNYAEKPIWTTIDEDGDGDLEYYSTASAPELNLAITADIDLSSYGVSPILTFDTKYIIEEAWDFGFVQISTDDGNTWTSLVNDLTRYDIVDEGYPAIRDNLPGFTGVSDGWVSTAFDLSAYEGMNVKLCFRYMTDWGYEDPGWYVDNIAINSIMVDDIDNVNAFVIPPPAETDFIVTFITATETSTGIVYNDIITLQLDTVEEITLEAIALNSILASGDVLYMVVSATLGLTDYKFSVIKG